MPIGYGLEWRAAEARRPCRGAASSNPRMNPSRQIITIEPHGRHWLFALDWPAEAPAGISLVPGNYLRSPQPIREPRPAMKFDRFRHWCKTNCKSANATHCWPFHKKYQSAVRPSPKSWRAGARTRRRLSKTLCSFFAHRVFVILFRRANTRITTSTIFFSTPPRVLRTLRRCLCRPSMRLAGVPARVVTGYLGGEYNEIGQFYIVRQSDAHACVRGVAARKRLATG